MLFKRPLIVGALLVTAWSMSAGCSSKSNASKANSDKAADTKDAKSCPGTDAIITITETGETAEFTHAGGVSMADGAAYTVYLSDSEIDSKEISMLNTPEPVEDQHIVSVAITVFNAESTPPPITEGTKISFTPDFGVLTFRVTDATTSESYTSSADAKGTVKVTKVGDTVCFTVDYSDDEKTLTGSVEAPVSEL